MSRHHGEYKVVGGKLVALVLASLTALVLSDEVAFSILTPASFDAVLSSR